jgi:AcrR family transcriptional regulator
MAVSCSCLASTQQPKYTDGMAMTKLPKRTGRPRGFDKDEALEGAMHVFWRKGFEGASLNDLTAAMGIQPASLYQAFGNKRTL